MLQHPKALAFLCLTEMWERFGFYVVQGLLVLYVTKSFGFSDAEAFTISGLFAAMVYIAPLLGGVIADRVIGFKTAIIWGGLFLCFGYGLLSLVDQDGFYIALSTIIVGNGLFKPNISSLLGTLYNKDAKGRDTGFTLFYIGINIGVLLSGFSGWIQSQFGWTSVYLCASLGMLIGLIIFSMGLKWGGIPYQPTSLQLSQKKYLHKVWLIFYCILSIFIISYFLRSVLLSRWLLPVVGIFLLFFLTILTYGQKKEIDRDKLLTLNILNISSIIFWMIFLQIFFSATLFIDRLINKNIMGVSIPTSAFYTLESIFVILLGTIFAWSWQTLSYNNRNPSPFFKFGLAIVFSGIAFLTLAMSTYFSSANHLINPLWIVLSYFFMTMGEMLLSPIGLSIVTALSPARYTGMMMGVWFVALGFGGQFAGWLATLASVPEFAMNDPIYEMMIYRRAFFYYAGIAFLTAAILYFIQKAFKNILLVYERNKHPLITE